MNDLQMKGLETYFRLMTMNGAARVFHTAQEFGVLGAFKSGPADADAVAKACGTQPGPTALLLDALCAAGVLVSRDRMYDLGAAARLLTGGYRDLGDAYWNHLPQFLRSGMPLVKMDDAGQSEGCYQAQAAALEWMMMPSAEAAAAALGIGRSKRYASVLDVGAGSAVWSLTFARHDPDMRVTALDWPAVLDVAKGAAQRAGLLERFSTIAGDYRKIELPPAAYDLAIVANVAHLETPEGNVALFRKLHRTLRPGGEVAIIDVFPGRETGDLSRTLYALGLALRTENGRVYRAEDVSAFLREAGFQGCTMTNLDAVPHTMGMAVARKTA